jgi:hypothetical protein
VLIEEFDKGAQSALPLLPTLGQDLGPQSLNTLQCFLMARTGLKKE